MKKYHISWLPNTTTPFSRGKVYEAATPQRAIELWLDDMYQESNKPDTDTTGWSFQSCISEEVIERMAR